MATRPTDVSEMIDTITYDRYLARAVPAAPVDAAEVEQAATLRATLPLQAVAGVRLQVQAQFGLAHGDLEIARRLVALLPPRLFRAGAMVCQQIDQYREEIPDAALLKWGAARQSGHFATFCIAQPTYDYQSPRISSPDPWLIGWLKEPTNHVHIHGTCVPAHWKASARGDGHGIVLAYWE